MADPAETAHHIVRAPANLLAKAGHNKPAVIGVAVVGGLGLAYYIHKHSNAQAAIDQPQDTQATLDNPPPDYTDAGYGYGGASGAGSYYGQDYPIDNSGGAPVNGVGATSDPNGSFLLPAVNTPVVPTVNTGVATGGTESVAAIVHHPGNANMEQAITTFHTAQVQNSMPITGGGLPGTGTDPHVQPETKPNLGPGIFYNTGRGLRYIVARQNSAKQRGYTCDYRRYESRLNKGDWGQGGVILIDGSCHK